MNIEKLKANPDNPRKVTDKKLEMLKRALDTFGDLSGIVFNRRTKQLVGGHQRVASLKGSDAIITIEKKYSKPTRTGTVAEGFVTALGERYSYREVDWDEARESAANLAANKSAGDWDRGKLTGFLQDLSNFKIDLDLTMFDSLERVKFFRDDDDEKPVKEKSRSASDDIVMVQLTFTKESADRFRELIEHFQKLLEIPNTTDCVLEVLQLAKASSE